MKRILSQYSIKATTNDFLLAEGLIPDTNSITTCSRLWFNPGRQESLYIVPYLVVFFASRFWALVRKEINQISRNKQLIVLLTFPPTIQLLIYGYALNPDIHYLKMGVVDYARSHESRELISTQYGRNY